MDLTLNAVIALVIGFILSFNHIHMEVYGQIANGNSTFAETVDCFVHPCDESIGPSPSNVSILEDGQNTTTALVGISFNNVTLKDIRDNKDNIKYSVSEYINTTIDQLAGGQATTFTTTLPGFECTPARCIVGIIFPPNWPEWTPLE